ncbi:MAG: hypothetical protein GWP91_18065 [Rhodobacterales bacterium]|nr:hypothetical protein [Rhodobacterales bacterium]
MWWGWWLTTLVLTLFLAWRKLGTLAPSAVMQWLLPPGGLSDKSTRADLLVIVLKHALGVLLAQLLFTGPEVASWATETLQSWTGTNTLGLEIGWAGRLLWTAAILLVIDASIFLAHDSLHKVPFLGLSMAWTSEKLSFGLIEEGKDDLDRHSLFGLYVEPFLNAIESLRILRSDRNTPEP